MSPKAAIVAFLVMGYRESVFTHSLCHGFLPKLLLLHFWSWVIGNLCLLTACAMDSPKAIIVAFLVKGYRESVVPHSLRHGFLCEL